MPRIDARRYIGWMVLCQERGTVRDRKVYRAHSRQEAEECVRTLNARAVQEHGRAAPLYFCEWWSTSSSLDGGPGAEVVEQLCAAAEPDEDHRRLDWTPEDIGRVLELSKRGWGTRRIGLSLGRNASSIWDVLQRHSEQPVEAGL